MSPVPHPHVFVARECDVNCRAVLRTIRAICARRGIVVETVIVPENFGREALAQHYPNAVVLFQGDRGPSYLRHALAVETADYPSWVVGLDWVARIPLRKCTDHIVKSRAGDLVAHFLLRFEKMRRKGKMPWGIKKIPPADQVSGQRVMGPEAEERFPDISY